MEFALSVDELVLSRLRELKASAAADPSAIEVFTDFLHHHFGRDPVVDRALEAIDRDNVTMLLGLPSGRRFFQVAAIGSTLPPHSSSYAADSAASGDGGPSTVLVDGAGYCSCSEYRRKVLLQQGENPPSSGGAYGSASGGGSGHPPSSSAATVTVPLGPVGSDGHEKRADASSRERLPPDRYCSHLLAALIADACSRCRRVERDDVELGRLLEKALTSAPS